MKCGKMNSSIIHHAVVRRNYDLFVILNRSAIRNTPQLAIGLIVKLMPVLKVVHLGISGIPDIFPL